VRADLLTPSLRKFEPVIPADVTRGICHWLIDSTTRPLSYARRDLIRRSDAEWVIFVDDDVEWSSRSLMRLLEVAAASEHERTGAVETQVRIPGRGYYFKSSQVTRGWTGFTLIRREIAKDWAPPPMDRYEDEHLRRHILRKGYRWERLMDVSVIHHLESRSINLRAHYLDGRGARHALPPAAKAVMVLKTPLFVRHGRTRFVCHVYFLLGMLGR
jgi:hypothetical protein